MKKVVIFGARQEGIRVFFDVCEQDEVVAFIDNDLKLQGQYIYNIKIISPNDLEDIDYDIIYITSWNAYYYAKYKQLIAQGVDKNKIKIMQSTERIKQSIDEYKLCVNDAYEIYETNWRVIRKKYKKISLHKIFVGTLGETVLRLCTILDDEMSVDKDTLRVFIQDVGNVNRICNKELMNCFKDRIYIADWKETDFWNYVLCKYREELNLGDYNKYMYRMNMEMRRNADKIFFKFRKEQIELAQKKMVEMGIDRKYVCVAARSSDYAKSSLKSRSFLQDNISSQEYRNTDFYKLSDAIHYLKTQNLQTVKMGRGELPMDCSMDNCIDYAGLYADDFMDLYLLANCCFMISSGGSGIYEVAAACGKPVLLVSNNGMALGYGGEPYTEYDLAIPKKVYVKDENKYLTLLEQARLENIYFINGIEYERNGIVFEENTSAEILDAVKEMWKRMNGEWHDTEEDTVLIDRYSEIMKQINNYSINNINNWMGGAMPQRMAVSYLRNNLYLLN